MEVDGRQYVITAKHVVAGLQNSQDVVTLCRSSADCTTLSVKIFRCDDPIDIAVLAADTKLTVTYPLPAELKGIAFGQDVFFIGFPFGSYNYSTIVGADSVPFIKKGIISANDGTRLFVDGNNNPGFSGSPIVYRDLSHPNEIIFKVAGVISGFQNQPLPVLRPTEIRPDQITPEDRAASRLMESNGKVFRLLDTGTVVQSNTGIVIGHAIDYAIELIRKNPVGFNISN